MFADQLGWFWGQFIGLYGSPMECLGKVIGCVHQPPHFVRPSTLGSGNRCISFSW